jgi:uncharacterized protein (TIGR02996 family)
MTPDDAFLADIIANPDDDAPRLVYADWLEDHGQPGRAAFIRIQCELARDALRPDTRREDLEAKERELLRRHRRDWLRPLRGLLTDCEFRRGFVEQGSVPGDAFVRRAEAIFRATPLRHVRLKGDLSQVDRLAACPHLARLGYLRCSLRDLDAAGLRTLLSSPHLTGLRALDLGLCWLGTESVRALLDWPGLPRLAELNLGGSLHGEGAHLLARSPSVRGLTRLFIDNNGLRVTGVEAVAGSPHLAGLTDLGLGLGLCWLGTESVRALLDWPGLPRLAELNLGGSLHGEGAHLLARSPSDGPRRGRREAQASGPRGAARAPGGHWAVRPAGDARPGRPTGGRACGPRRASTACGPPRPVGLGELRVLQGLLGSCSRGPGPRH